MTTLLRFCAVLAAGTALASASPHFTASPLAARSKAPAGGKAFTRLDSTAAGLTVPNVFNDPRMWGNRFRELTLGAVETGVAVADFDRDGKPDIYAISKNGPCALYRQVAPFQFENVAAKAGVEIAAPEGGVSSNTGATAVDINQDGAMDLYICRYELPNLLFVNNGDGTFTEKAKEYGLDVKDASVHATFADYDRDGFLDCYIVTNILDFSKAPQGRRDFLFRNSGDGKFADVTAKAGIWGLTQGHTALWFDANQDGWPDIYVANDFETPDRFYLNKGDGTFVDVVDERLPHVTYFSMGADAGDVNNDGLVDFLITDMRDRSHSEYMAGMEEIGRGLWETERVTDLVPQYMWNAFYLNTGTDRFKEVARITGMAATGWTWAARFGDLDNDGRLDVFYTTGMIRNFIDADLVDKQNVAPTLAARAAVWKNSAPRKETTLAYRNLGDLRFSDTSKEWGLDENTVSFGCAVADLDGDGDLDLVYSNYEAPPTVVRNDTTHGNAAVIRLSGQAPNREGVGAELRIETAAGVQVRQLFNERGIAASEPAEVHFGLGEETSIRKLTIRWPRGQVQELADLPANQLLTITEPALAEGSKPAPAKLRQPARADALLTEAAQKRGLEHTLKLRPFDEFIGQRLLPRRLNGLGPALASADVNGDGLADLFVSGSAGQSGRLFLAKADGTFAPAPSQPWETAAEADDSGAVFFDANGDGVPDLFISAGGVQKPRGDALQNDRLYLNDGKGQFTLAEGALPADGESTQAVAAADFNGDGKVDLFVGGRSVPGKYPSTPKSFLYRNEGGRFVDVTDSVAAGLREIGLVTAAQWADIDGDGKVDLLVATEWGTVTLFRNDGKALRAKPLTAATGWWSALAVADVNGDGRLDVVAGNNGLNTKYHASATEPTELYAGDFDGTGRVQLVEAQYEGGKLVPLRGRSKLARSGFPTLPKQITTYKAYAESSLTDIFGADKLARVQRLAATELASGVFVQQEDHSFRFEPLPRKAQLAPINAIVARDLDRDGKLDLLVVGNCFGPEATTGRFDGGVGLVLKGDGKGGFTPLLPADSGVVVTGEARAAVVVPGQSGDRIVVARNQGPLLVFERK